MTQKKIEINPYRIDPYKNPKFRIAAPAPAEGEPATAGPKKKAVKASKKAAKKAAVKS
jgi:hypothetical protein